MKFWIGPLVNDPVAAAVGTLSFADVAPAPNSRRVTANAVHINGAAAGPGTSPLPEANQDNSFAPTPDTEPAPATTGAEAATGAAIDPAVLRTAAPAPGALTFAGAAGEAAGEAGAAVGPPPTAWAEDCGTPAADPESSAAADMPTGLSPNAPEDRAEESDDSAESDRDDGAVMSASSPFDRALAAEPDRPLRAPRPAESAPGSGAGEPALLPENGASSARPARRDGEVARVEADEAAESAAPDPVEPAEPVVSAKATGIGAAEPMPNATASTPIRPTCRA